MIVFWIVLGCIAALALTYIFVLIRPQRLPKSTDPALLCNYAHRGLHGKTVGDIPENSLAAYRMAVKLGYGIELDVQLSKDGEVMVFHDYTLDRMTGVNAKLADKTVEELKKLHLKTAEGLNTREKIPTLREVLELVDGKVPLLVELKGENFNTSLCPKVDEILSEYHGAYCIESFNPLLIRWYKRNRPDILRGMLYTDICQAKGKKTLLNFLLSAMALNVLAQPHFIAYDLQVKDKLPVKLTTGLFSAERFVWTIRTEDELKQAEGEHVIFENVRP